MDIEVVQGRTKTILRSGSDVRVNSGQARINLVKAVKSPSVVPRTSPS